MVWNEQRISLKFSFHKSKYFDNYHQYGFLGDNLTHSVLKDYNGQTYWLSTNVASFLPEDTGFPKWLNFAVGYGSDGMLAPVDNRDYSNEIERFRQYYVSFDIDLSRIKTKSKLANTLLGSFGFIKFPMPTIEFNQGRETKFYWLFF